MIWRLFTESYGDYKAGQIVAYPLGTWRAFPADALERCSVQVEEAPRSSLRLPHWATEAIRARRAEGRGKVVAAAPGPARQSKRSPRA